MFPAIGCLHLRLLFARPSFLRPFEVHPNLELHLRRTIGLGSTATLELGINNGRVEAPFLRPRDAPEKFLLA